MSTIDDLMPTPRMLNIFLIHSDIGDVTACRVIEALKLKNIFLISIRNYNPILLEFYTKNTFQVEVNNENPNKLARAQRVFEACSIIKRILKGEREYTIYVQGPRVAKQVIKETGLRLRNFRLLPDGGNDIKGWVTSREYILAGYFLILDFLGKSAELHSQYLSHALKYGVKFYSPFHEHCGLNVRTVGKRSISEKQYIRANSQKKSTVIVMPHPDSGIDIDECISAASNLAIERSLPGPLRYKFHPVHCPSANQKIKINRMGHIVDRGVTCLDVFNGSHTVVFITNKIYKSKSSLFNLDYYDAFSCSSFPNPQYLYLGL